MVAHDFFELFALPRSYSVDEQLLLSRYREMQRSVHPDRHVNASAQQKRLAVQRSGLINEGYQTLSAPLMRARHLLECSGVVVNTESTGGSVAFLEEQMALHEELDALRRQKDQSRLAEMEQQMDARWVALESEFASLVESEQADEAMSRYHDMQFVERLRSQIKSERLRSHAP